MRTATITLGAAFVFITTTVFAGTKLDFWHSYVHAQTHQTHYSFHLAKFKRGLFFGSCGPSAKSLQWSYNFDLTGDGPVYSSQQLSLIDENGKSLRIVSGQVATDLKRGTANIAIKVEIGGTTNIFVGNGQYRIHQVT